MVSPAVQHLTTHGARRVVIPKRHAETALQSSAKEEERRHGCQQTKGLAVSQGPSPGNGAGVEVESVGSAKMRDTDWASTLHDRDFCDGELRSA